MPDAAEFVGLQLDTGSEGDDPQPGGVAGAAVRSGSSPKASWPPASAGRGTSSAPRAALRSTGSIREEPLMRAMAGSS